MMEKIKTADGTETFFNEEYKEAYHSTKAGAYTESLHKFVIPSKIPQLAKDRDKILILDVGFGLGYNVAVALLEAKKVNPDIKLEVISIEKDKANFEKIKNLNVPEFLSESYKILTSGKFKNFDINSKTFYGYELFDKNLNLKVILGEGRQTLKSLKDIGIKFDAVFFDAFSPKVNTEMWTIQLFKIVKSLMKDYAILSTYSASLAVRKGLQEAGFKIGLVEPIGRKSYSTVATIKGDVPSITEKELYRLKNSPYAIPYKDNEELNLPAKKIKENWEKEVEKKLEL